MRNNIDLNELELKVKKILDNDLLGTTVELSDLSETAYTQLANRFLKNYEVKGIINIVKMETEDRTYILHIRKKENA